MIFSVKITNSKFEQLANAYSPNSVNELGKVIYVIELHSAYALNSIDLIFVEKFGLFKSIQDKNVYGAMRVI